MIECKIIVEKMKNKTINFKKLGWAKAWVSPAVAPPLLNPQIVSSLLEQQPDPNLSSRFFNLTTRFLRFQRQSSSNLIINCLVSNDNNNLFDLYWGILDELKGQKYTLHPAAFSVLISAYLKLNQPEKAVETFDKMKDFDCTPDLFTFNLVLRLMVEKEITFLALPVFNMMLRFDCNPDCETFNILIDGLCKSRKLRDALKLFDEMSDRGIVPNKDTYRVVLTGLCRENRVDDALGLFHTMKTRGFQPDLIIYNVLLNGFCKMGRIDEAFSFSKSFRDVGYFIGIRGYSSLIDGLVNANRTREALCFFLKLFQIGRKPDVVLYTIMIRGLCNMRRLDDALNLMSDMKGRGLVPDTPCYNTLIKGLCDMGLLDQALALYLEIVKDGYLPSSQTYTILICGMCKNGLLGEAQQLFNEMEKLGCSPSVNTFNALIDGLCKAGKLEEARLMFYKMEIGKNPSVFLRLSQGADKVLDSKSLQVMVEKLCESGLVLKAYKLLKQLADSGVVPDIYTYNILINGYCKAEKVDAALKVYEELHLKGLSPDLVTFVTLMDGLQRVGREKEAMKFYEQMSKTKYSHFPVAHLVVMKWCCQKGKNLLAFSKWLNYQKNLEGGQDDKTLQLVEKLIESGDIVMALRMLLERDIKLKNMEPGPYNAILIGLCQAQRTKEAIELFVILEEFSSYISPPSCVLLISYLLRENSLDHAVDVFLYTLDKGFHLMPRVWNNLIGSLLDCQERATNALLLLRKMKSFGYDLNSYLHDATRYRLYRHWSTRKLENDTPRWDAHTAKIHLSLPPVTIDVAADGMVL